MTEIELMYLVITANLVMIGCVFHRTDLIGWTSLNSLMYNKSEIVNSIGWLATRSSDIIAICFAFSILGIVASTLYSWSILTIVLMCISYGVSYTSLRGYLGTLNNNRALIVKGTSKLTDTNRCKVYLIDIKLVITLATTNVVYVLTQIIKGI